MRKKSMSSKGGRTKSTHTGLGLFDHIKHIQNVQDPNYYRSLSEDDKKTFNLFLILRGLSMRPDFLEYATYLYRFLQIIPPEQFYTVLIALYPKHRFREFYRWVKGKKEAITTADKKTLPELVADRFEIGKEDAKDYIKIYLASKEGRTELLDLIKGMGVEEKEAEEMM